MTEKEKMSSNLWTVFAIILGILLAAAGILLPMAFFGGEENNLLSRQYTVDLLSSDSVQAVVRDTSFSLEDYAYITKMTSSGVLYYMEPTTSQLTMREASNAAGEILKALLPDVFTGSVHQPYTLTSAVLTSNAQGEAFDARQSFWYIDLSYLDEVYLSSTVNSVNGKAWNATAEFLMDGEYARLVADDILTSYDISINLFYTWDAYDAAVSNSGKTGTSARLLSTENYSTVGQDGSYYVADHSDNAVLIENVSDFYNNCEVSLQTLQQYVSLLEDLYCNYTSYLGVPNLQDADSYTMPADADNVEKIYQCAGYSCKPADLQNMISRLDELKEAEASLQDDSAWVSNDFYETAFELMSYLDYVSQGFCMLDLELTATEEATGLCVSTGLQISCDDCFFVTVELSAE